MPKFELPQKAKGALITLIDDIIVHSPIEVMVSPAFVTIFDKEFRAYEFSTIKRLHADSWGLYISNRVWSEMFPGNLRALIEDMLKVSKHRVYMPHEQAIKKFGIKATSVQYRAVCVPLREYDRLASRDWNKKLDSLFLACKASLICRSEVA